MARFPCRKRVCWPTRAASFVRSDLVVDRSGRPLTTSLRPPITSTSGCRRTTPGWHFSCTDPLSQAPDVWVLDLARGTSSRTDFGSIDRRRSISWLPASDQIIYSLRCSERQPRTVSDAPRVPAPTLTDLRPEGTTQPLTAPRNVLSTDWSSDRKFVIYHWNGRARPVMTFGAPGRGRRKPISMARAQYDEVQGACRPTPDGSRMPLTSPANYRFTGFRAFRIRMSHRKRRYRLRRHTTALEQGRPRALLPALGRDVDGGRRADGAGISVGRCDPSIQDLASNRHERISDGLCYLQATDGDF